MKTFTEPLTRLQVYEEITDRYRTAQKPLAISGCTDPQKCHFMYGIGEDSVRKLIITGTEQRARQIAEAYGFYSDTDAVYFPAKDLLFYQSDIRGNALTKERMAAYEALLTSDHAVIVTTFDALLGKITAPRIMQDAVLRLEEGGIAELAAVRIRLTQMGYESCCQVEQPGQFAVRGGILDIFPLTAEQPVRIEFWDDELDTIRNFQVDTQRSYDERLSRVEIFPAGEVILPERIRRAGIEAVRRDGEQGIRRFREERKTEEAFHLKELTELTVTQLQDLDNPDSEESMLPYFEDAGFETAGLLDFFADADSRIFVDEPARCLETAQQVEQEFHTGMQARLEQGLALPGQMRLLQSVEETVRQLREKKPLLLTVIDGHAPGLEPEAVFHVPVKPVNSYNSNFELLVKDLKRYGREKYSVVFLCASATRGRHMAGELLDRGLTAFYTEDRDRIVQNGEILVTRGSLTGGYEYPDIRFVVLTERDIFGARRKKRRHRKIYDGQNIQSFSELHPGDYVVHVNHGLGLYRGIEKVEVDHTIKDYMKIEYADHGFLYVAASQMDMIQKYAGADARRPKLNRLGSTEWHKTRSRVQKAVEEIAEELVELYAVRQEKNGYCYPADTIWQREFEEQFPYEETEDQLTAIAETKADMESSKIMDRLICGDVGFGKTEVAVRAAFKAVQEEKQVVVLVPTTILAQQHYNTFLQRMKDYPVTVGMLSRFRTPAQIRETIAGLKKGTVDIVVGTHRVLSKDVVFKDLGLLVIDEEQRFGVTHKERIKQLKKNVDVLTLSATPIPRTLHMSLAGIRDMSVLTEPPQDRYPVQTYIMEYNEEMIREAVNRELARDGQVYYVYNRVKDIAEMAARIQQLVPDAEVAYAHGQMPERRLEEIMYQYINHEIDVLVSTTIIETGLDIANVNTMIIHDADTMGLSQLYQLRGRIGRSNRTAYAFLMYRRNKILRETAEKRLSAIRDFSDLGSGFRIAMKDLEIRGAGNVLGEAQSGHMEAVGYDLYCKMLNEAVREVKGEQPRENFETSIDIDLDAYIPPSYIPDEVQKLEIYRRISMLTDEADRDEMLDELIDRFGDPPRVVQDLLTIAQLRAEAHSCYFTEIAEKGNEIRFVFYEKAAIDPEKFQPFVDAHRHHFTFQAGGTPSFHYHKQKNSPDSVTLIRQFLADCRAGLLMQELTEASAGADKGKKL
jgi:transcription-repair coupling factor (superfamily II helicase)